MEDGDRGDRLHAMHVDGDDAALAVPRLHPLDRHLRPAAGSRPQIDDPGARLQEAEFVVDLGELEGGAGTVTHTPRFCDIGIIELALEPDLLRDGAALAGLDPDFEAPGIPDRAAARSRHGLDP